MTTQGSPIDADVELPAVNFQYHGDHRQSESLAKPLPKPLHRSIGLTTVLTELISNKACVLDLGPMSAGTLQAFLNKNCKVYFEDLNTFVAQQKLSMLNAETEGELETKDLAAALDKYLLGNYDKSKFDVILAWDVFNYLPLDTIEYLMQKLKPHCKSGTILHTLRYVGTQMPALPRRFNLQNNFELLITESSDGSIPTQAHSTYRLLQRLERFQLQNTLMNQEGMLAEISEHLLIYDALSADNQSTNKVHQANPTELVSHFGHQNGETAIQLPALRELLEGLGAEKRSSIDQMHVFDNGAKVGRSLDRLTTIASELYVEDLFASNYWQKKIEGSEHSRVSKHALSFPENLRFDLVLLWDLFNHCTDEQVSAIAAMIFQHLGESSRLHFIAYSGFVAASRPPLFEIQQDLSVKIVGPHASGLTRSAKALVSQPLTGEQQSDVQAKQQRSSAALLKLLPQYSVERTVFGKLNTKQFYQEFLLVPKNH